MSVFDRSCPERKGYNCLFMGHSFFAPIARSFAEHPARCGFTEHRQTIVAHGGMDGAPGALWNSQMPDVAQARELLETGAVDLVGLTCYPGAGSDLADYHKWVDLALAKNSQTCFVIQAPWTKYENKTFAQYEAQSEAILAYVHGIIGLLRQAYPQTTLLCIPQGRWMTGLWRLYEEGRLPEISELKRNTAAEHGPWLFDDDLGHGGQLPIRLGSLLWLAVIYKVDLNHYPWQTNVQFDLKKFAQEIVQSAPSWSDQTYPDPGGK